LSPKEQVLTLQAINLSILLFANEKRALLLSSRIHAEAV